MIGVEADEGASCRTIPIELELRIGARLGTKNI